MRPLDQKNPIKGTERQPIYNYKHSHYKRKLSQMMPPILLMILLMISIGDSILRTKSLKKLTSMLKSKGKMILMKICLMGAVLIHHKIILTCKKSMNRYMKLAMGRNLHKGKKTQQIVSCLK